ncbi:hypothetical protein KZZ20_04820 [Methylacidiphilum fumariolicum]|uniref:Uncharacterized protein n=2 Tax=Candidatus Methylacidiphilum fumarolicum TaxID=591154 RepID=I0JVJ7_METFB|nr:hypothetical protein [Candidatus Methylacidiphilum fumarolicum]MBW6414837.1 hypothetical protein [Candidatus Methylacidiphilum fumarolicum]CAI9084595.1 conserved protein of unknown function [Candidatus Methylacidiphilum fumarolicum]CCG91266.1 hypothetical protein MFUM_1010090 [Methylacidiphilum fumariolicum SolV]
MGIANSIHCAYGYGRIPDMVGPASLITGEASNGGLLSLLYQIVYLLAVFPLTHCWL